MNKYSSLCILTMIFGLLKCNYEKVGDIPSDTKLKERCSVVMSIIVDSQEMTIEAESLSSEQSKDSSLLSIGVKEAFDVSRDIKLQSKEIRLLMVRLGSDAILPMVLVRSRYGLWLQGIPGTRENLFAFNLLNAGLPAIELDSRESFLQFVDFYLRLSTPSLKPTYRINTIEDIGSIDGYTASEDYYSRKSKLLMVESMEKNTKMPGWIEMEAEIMDSLRSVIRASDVNTSEEPVIVTTFAWNELFAELVKLELKLRKTGEILSINKFVLFDAGRSPERY